MVSCINLAHWIAIFKVCTLSLRSQLEINSRCKLSMRRTNSFCVTSMLAAASSLVSSNFSNRFLAESVGNFLPDTTSDSSMSVIKFALTRNLPETL